MFRTLMFLMLAASLVAQDAVNRFRVRMGNRASGTEEYRLRKAPEGLLLTGKVEAEIGGSPGSFTYEALLAPDRSLARYKLEIQLAGTAQTVEAYREGEKLMMKAGAAGQSASKAVDFTPRVVLLDNMITGHYQLLLDGLPGVLGEITALIPQRQGALASKLTEAGESTATLDGNPVKTRKYVLSLGSLPVEILALAPSNRLLRVAIPSQDIELTREGFAVPKETAPAEPMPASVQERQLAIPSGDLQLPGTLCWPAKSTGRAPLIVFVHGSGPHDRDETVGPNKPFRDLAWGLAEAGIATLRYDKRTYRFFAKMDLAKFTVEEEVIADAVAALEYAKTQPEADLRRIFLAGHSLGGAMAPLIAARVPQLGGVIVMAGTTRPLDELIYEQTAFQSGVQGKSREVIARQVADLKQAFARIRSKEAKDTEQVMGAPAYYWRDLLERDLPAAWKKVSAPVLVLQGAKDVQVVKTDYDGLLRAVKAESHWLPNLNHLFMPVEGAATGAEYSKPSKVDPEVIKLIAAWVGKN
jgi:hypothetical protein